jgi:uncharacterized RDD family membrane protein YckC
MNNSLSKSSDNAESFPTVINNSSPLPLITRRVCANLVDATMLGAVSAALVFAQMSIALPGNIQDNLLPLSITTGLAFALAFLDVLTFTGFLLIPATLFLFAMSYPLPDQAYFLLELIPLNMLYHVIFEGSTSGATPGKQLFDLRLETVDGQPMGFKRAFKRHCAKVVSSLLHLCPVLHLLGSRRQLLHDRIAKVQVTQRKNQITQPANENLSVGTISEIECAGLWHRIGAAMLDSVSTTIVALITFPCLMLCFAYIAPAPNSVTEAMIGVGSLCLLGTMFAYVASVLLMVALESSSLQATPGKIVMGLMVTNSSGKRIGFLQSLIKQATQLLLYYSLFPVTTVLMIPVFFMAPITDLEFKISLVALLGWTVLYLMYGTAMCASFFSKRQSLLDILCKRYVLVDWRSSNADLVKIK